MITAIHNPCPANWNYSHNHCDISPFPIISPTIVAEILELVDDRILDGIVCGYTHHHNKLELVTYYSSYPNHINILA